MELAAKQLESVKDQFTRLTGEYDNDRKRTTKEKDGIYQDAKGDTIKTFLAVYDNLERAAAAEGGEDDPHKKGLEMIFHQFKELLAKGFQIRAFALESDPKLPQLKELGPNVEVVCGDLLDEESIYSAVQGCDGVFFLPAIPTSGDPTKEITLGKNMVSACERANVTYMVHSSVDRAGEEETFKGWGPDFWPGYAGYWRGKSTVLQMVKDSKIPHWVILKPAYMMDCFVPPKAWGMYPQLKQGIVASARTPETWVNCMCGDDMGKLVAEVFCNFEKFEHKEIPLAGDRVNMDEVGAAISKATGKHIEVQYLTREQLLANGVRSSVIDAQEWDVVNGYTADVVASNSYGVKLSTFEEWALRHKDDFDID